jgi:Na+/proline symporter
MATHGTDQDMVQRMLTATDYRKSRLSLILSGLADVPVVLCFLSLGILLWVYYAKAAGGIPQVGGVNIPDNEIFAHYIVYEMPVGLRGLIIAGVFATMMGSTSAALNALATSFTKDFYLPYINRGASDHQAVTAARVATAVFGLLMIGVATVAAYSVLKNPHLTIIPIAIGILGYTYGALLGVFLLGMLTRNRGRDGTNVIAMLLGMTAVLFLCKVDLPGIFNFGLLMPEWWPKISWPWFVLVGCTVTCLTGVLFRTPEAQVQRAAEHVARNADAASPAQ